jgi:hypothetical protein
LAIWASETSPYTGAACGQIGAVDGSLAQHGGVVLELQPGENAPEIRLRRRNVAVLRPQTVERSYAKEVNVG